MLSRGKINFIGYSTVFVVTTGTHNTAIGYGTVIVAIASNTISLLGYNTGTYNTAVGYRTGI